MSSDQCSFHRVRARIGDGLSSAWSRLSQLLGDKRGGTLPFIALAILPMLAVAGSAIDIARAYVVQSRMQLACDSAVLEGRRIMRDDSFTQANIEDANGYFYFNFPAGTLGSTTAIPQYSVRKDSADDGTILRADASTSMPNLFMQIFGNASTPVGVHCEARWDNRNLDIMFSFSAAHNMDSPVDNSYYLTAGKTSKTQALRTAIKSFYDTIGTGNSHRRIRYGFAPFSSDINVGYILPSSYISDQLTVPSRDVLYLDYYTSPSHLGGAKRGVSGTTTYTNEPAIYRSMPSALSIDIGGRTYIMRLDSTTFPPGNSSADCAGVDLRFTGLKMVGDVQITETPEKAGAGTYYSYTFSQAYSGGTIFRYAWDGSGCQMQYGEVSGAGIRTVRVKTDYQISNWSFGHSFNRWFYHDLVHDVSRFKLGQIVPTPTYESGHASDEFSMPELPATSSWDGCIGERQTVNSITGSSAIMIPEGAYDLDVDLTPSNDATRWKARWQHVSYMRYTSNKSFVQNELMTRDATFIGINAYGKWKAISVDTCPPPARRLYSYDSRSSSPTEASGGLSSFDKYVDSLWTADGLYGDLGMLWAGRLISPTGIFAADNNSAPNDLPIHRHIIFLSNDRTSDIEYENHSYGYTYLSELIAPWNTHTDGLIALHDRRLQIVCNQLKGKGVIIWVVAFAVEPTTAMKYCATDANHLSTVDTADSLNNRFKAIAASIGGLRLSK